MVRSEGRPAGSAGRTDGWVGRGGGRLAGGGSLDGTAGGAGGPPGRTALWETAADGRQAPQARFGTERVHSSADGYGARTAMAIGRMDAAECRQSAALPCQGWAKPDADVAVMQC